MVEKRGKRGNILCALGKKYHFGKGGGRQKYHILGKYTPLRKYEKYMKGIFEENNKKAAHPNKAVPRAIECEQIYFFLNRNLMHIRAGHFFIGFLKIDFCIPFTGKKGLIKHVFEEEKIIFRPAVSSEIRVLNFDFKNSCPN